ncbi:MAG: hypothetical protein HWN66_22380 [Candidatus Helarchaeota archaeon]|nr:hypothetical protein [Candidatus Helarchaeota archaeon]
MNFFQFIYSAISVVIGVGIGWLLTFISQWKMQKNQHKFELEKLKIERLYNLKFEAYSHIWAECMKCWREFFHKQWVFKDENTTELLNAYNDFNYEFSRNSITLEKSIVETIQYLGANFYAIIINHAMLVANKNDNNANKNMREHTEKTKELLDKLVEEIRKDLQLPQIEKSLAETSSPKKLPDKKSPKR